MVLRWVSEEGEFFSAERPLGGKGTVHAVVESLGGAGWDWHVWDTAGRVQQRYGVADTLDEAMERAERALPDLLVALADQLRYAKRRQDPSHHVALGRSITEQPDVA